MRIINDRVNAVFEVVNLCFSYAEKFIINDLSVTLETGKFYGIMGPNGCGKTTFLDLLLRLHHPSKGIIKYNGKVLSAYSKKELSRQLALVPQNFYINFPFTTKEIVMMGRYPHISRFSAASQDDIDRVLKVMEQTETIQFQDRLITELSGGERQRVIFARAIAQDTPVLCLDEATSNLDISHAISLLNIAAERVIKENKTVIAVMQDINLAAAYCDDLIFMKQGCVVTQGSVDDVLTPDTIHSVFNVNAKVYFDRYANAKQVVFNRTKN